MTDKLHEALEAADAAYERGKYQEAADEYRRALQDAADETLALQGLARCAMQFDEYGEAIDYAERALERDAALPLTLSALGYCRMRQGELEQAEDALRRAKGLDPDLEAAHVNLGSVLLGQGRYEEAIPILRHATALNPERSITHYSLALALSSQKEYVEARGEAMEAFRLAPSLRTGIGVLWISLGRLFDNRLLFSVLFLICLLVPFAIASFYTMPLFVLLAAYLGIGAIALFQSGKRGLGLGLTAFLALMIVAYVYNFIYGIF